MTVVLPVRRYPVLIRPQQGVGKGNVPETLREAKLLQFRGDRRRPGIEVPDRVNNDKAACRFPGLPAQILDDS